MTLDQAIKHFGDEAALAAAAGVQLTTIAQWRYRGEIPPGKQYRLQVVTGGRLRADGKRA